MISIYQPTGFAERIFRERYGFSLDETWVDACSRVANAISGCEKEQKRTEVRDAFYMELLTNRFCPGGRILYAAGRPKGQMQNCFVIPTKDSREGWGKTVSDMIVVSGTGGGVGINCSPIRPRGSVISGHSGTATGAVSLMDIINAAGEVIRAGGGRRTALMLCLDHAHPDMMEFVHKKMDLHQLNNANVSISFMSESPADFLQKVARDEVHHFLWNEEIIGSIPARELWNIIVTNAVECGEPGILNGHLANTMSNIWYHKPLLCTNPCGEIWLEEYGSCDLGALVLPRFVQTNKPTPTVDWVQLGRSVQTAVRFLDNVLDVNTYPLREIEENCKNVRRLGLGVMGLHDMLIRLGIQYSSDQAIEFVDALFSFIKHKAYRASCFLAAEKGSFPALNRHKFVESGFCKELKIGIREDIVEHGIRNCALLTIAPTGTTGIVSQVTSGIEPMYAYAYRRRFRSGSDLHEETIEHPLFTELKGTPSQSLFESALDIPVEKHLRMQAVCQRHVDNAISKTINLKKSIIAADVSGLLAQYAGQLKGITLYRDGSRGESPIEPLEYEEAIRLQDCPSGVCEI